jgi:hypothetical protein
MSSQRRNGEMRERAAAFERFGNLICGIPELSDSGKMQKPRISTVQNQGVPEPAAEDFLERSAVFSVIAVCDSNYGTLESNSNCEGPTLVTVERDDHH